MADICLADIDTHIDASPADITTAADWLGKLKKGFDEARYSLVHTISYRAQLSGEFGRALNEYVNDIENGCWSASSELRATIDVINSWHDQVVWRKQDMTGYRDDAKAGGLSVNDDRYIKPPEEVANPGELPKNATAKQKTTWQTAHDDYEAYLEKKKLFGNLQKDANETRKKLTDWVVEHMTVSKESPLYELQVKALQDGSIKFAELGLENAYHGSVYNSLVARAVPAAAARAASKSGNPKVRAGKKSPNPDSVAKRAEASARTKAANTGLATKAAKVGARAGTVLTLALSGWEISRGSSPSQVGIETAAGFAGAALGTVAVVAGAVALGVSAPALLVVGAGVAGGIALSWGVGKAYEGLVPLRTRERIDEGIKDTWNATVGSAWKHVFG